MPPFSAPRPGAGIRSSSRRVRTSPRRPAPAGPFDPTVTPAGRLRRVACALHPAVAERDGDRSACRPAVFSRTQPVVDVVEVGAATLAAPNAVVPPLEMRKPSPLASVHLMPAVDEEQVNGARVIDMP